MLTTKKYVTILLSLSSGYFMTGQNIVNSVIGSSGVTLTSTKSQLSFNIGELSTQELSSTQQLLTEGFLQANHSRNSVNGLSDNGSKSNQYHIYPNPFNNSFQVSGGKTISQIKILNKNGQIVLETSDLSTLIDLSNVTSGVYIVQLKDKNSNTIKTIKTTKL